MPTAWHVLGAGAMGCLFANALARAGHSTTILLRPDSSEQKVTLTVTSEGRSSHIELPASSATAPGHISHLLVTTKAHQVRDAVMSIAHRLDAASCVLLLSNGLGFAEELRAELSAPAYFYGTTTEGAYRTGHRAICHAGRGITRLGQPGSATAPDWFEGWCAAVADSSWDPAIEQALWLKLAINCAINPLTALHRCPNGDLLGPQLAPRVATLCGEILQVSAAAGFGAITADLPVQVAQVLHATAKNRSSMLQDVLAGRGTEIDYITGYLLSTARQHHVFAPHNETLYRSIVNLDN